MSYEKRDFVSVPADVLRKALNVMVMKDGPERVAGTRSFVMDLVRYLPPEQSADIRKAILEGLYGEKEIEN